MSLRVGLIRLAAIPAVAGLSASGAALAQSCAMCYTSAAAAQEGGIIALRHGILILLFPPVMIFVGILITAFRKERVRSRSVAPWLEPRQASFLTRSREATASTAADKFA